MVDVDNDCVVMKTIWKTVREGNGSWKSSWHYAEIGMNRYTHLRTRWVKWSEYWSCSWQSSFMYSMQEELP